jgi:hypothetical protein
MGIRESARLISDLVPTHSDEVTNETRMELARAFRSVDATNAEVTWSDDDVFSEETIEMPNDCEATQL